MKAKKIFKPVKTTVDELFTWYMGTKDWDQDKYAEVTNVMVIDGEHAQDDGADGQNSLAFFAEHKHDKITVETLDELSNAYDLEFEVAGKDISMQSVNPALEVDDNY